MFQTDSLNDTPAGKPVLFIGSSISRNVKLATTVTMFSCFAGTRAGDIESYLKLLAKDKREYSKTVIHVSGNDTWLHQLGGDKSSWSLCVQSKYVGL